MGNRADRRASAKIAKQAVKRAKTPTEAGILRAAAAFAGDGEIGRLGAALADPGFDEAWTRLSDDLHDILDEHYPAFRVETYIEAGAGRHSVGNPDETATRLFVCPLVGTPDRLAAFGRDSVERGRLAAAFRESGIVPEAGRCAVVPVLLPLSAFAPAATSPGRLRALHDALADLAFDAGADAPTLEALFGALGLPAFEERGSGPVAAALVGIERMPVPSGAVPSIEELDAEDLAAAAAVASWYDSYAADLPGLSIGAPLDWPAAAAALAWESVVIPMDAARRRRGLPEAPADTIHCGPSDDGRQFVVSAIYGGEAVGPFSVSADLVWFDADAFFDRAEASAETLVEHDDEGPVIAPLLGGC